ncbi:MAG: 5'-3' exonuclease H3TH domain-containing protein [bacterium]
MSQRRLLLVDGTAMAYRAFFAIAALSTKSGTPTNAVFGFIKMLRQLERAWKPTHWCIVFDGGLPKERMEVLESYKAQREEMPGDLQSQLEPINEYLRSADVASIRLDGEEADDILATHALRARVEGAEVLIATGDKDLYQLVGDGISIVSLTKGGERMGPGEIVAKTGVPPERIVDWLALVGDSADNIPGVPGVGPKTAAKLLAQFPSLDEMWAAIDKVESERIRGNLLAHKDVVLRNLRLVRLRADMALLPEWDAWAVREPDPVKLVPYLDRMEFHTMARELREDASRLF